MGAASDLSRAKEGPPPGHPMPAPKAISSRAGSPGRGLIVVCTESGGKSAAGAHKAALERGEGKSQ